MAQTRAAQDLVLRGDEEALPYWAALWGPARACVSSHTAKTFKACGDHVNAERHYATAAKSRPSAEYQRITALTIAAQANEQAAQGHLEQACDTWERSLNLLEGVRSARAADAVASMRQKMRTFSGRGVRAAGELNERAQAWQAAHTLKG